MEEPILQFFKYDHLLENPALACKPFSELAAKIVETLPRSQERTVALVNLLESRDAVIRALIFKQI